MWFPASVDAAPKSSKDSAAVSPALRQAALIPIYQRCEREYDVPWSLLAAIDRYAELTKPKEVRAAAPYYGFAFQPTAWAGIDNPNPDDLDPRTIRLFRGLGVDANGDGLALPWDPWDRVTVLARWLDFESGEDDVETAVWDLLQDPVAAERIQAFARLFDRYGLNPKGNCFPVAKRYRYTVKATFGAGRSWGGRRVHEGVDIFAGYGTPVLACAHGYVELMGWNRYGGWRLGIRDTNNYYYYYAHLSSYAKGLKPGDLVAPGQVIGYVGSSGYGPPGTSGKFPPHLHFGIYKDTGRHEWAYNPAPQLWQWERMPQKIISPGREGG
jgi:murein DD-endopeptidase MepM/ murein hydrolase activator NlpD